MSLEPPTVSEAENAVPFPVSATGEALSVVDRIALRLLCTKLHGKPIVERAHELWQTTEESNRDAWRREAHALLADIANGDSGDFPAWPDYEVRHPDGDVHGGYDDISSASDFLDKVWPDGKIYRRDTVTLHTEWTEVPA